MKPLVEYLKPNALVRIENYWGWHEYCRHNAEHIWTISTSRDNQHIKRKHKFKLNKLTHVRIQQPSRGSIEYFTGNVSAIGYFNESFQHHRVDGPAVEYADGTKYWFLNGTEYTKTEFEFWSKLHE